VTGGPGGNTLYRGFAFLSRYVPQFSAQFTIDIITQLADGKLTYGQFSRRRTKNASSLITFRRAIHLRQG
jgi:hypothetical protein